MRPFLACLALAAWFGPTAPAAEIEGLYRSETAVRSRAEAARAEDIRAALGRVLKRLVRPNDLDSATVRGLLTKPQEYVEEFDYTLRGEGPLATPILRVDFDPARLDGELRRHGIPVWGAERPELLVWLAVRDKQGVWSSAAEILPQADRLLGGFAAERGLPLSLPLWDLPDRQALDWNDINTGNAERIRLAAQRYETDTVLTGRLSPVADDTWEAEWRLYSARAPERWQSKTATLADTLAAGIETAYARLLTQGVPRDTTPASVELHITGLESLDDANQIAAYLEKLSPVNRLEWLAVGTGEAVFKLVVRGGREALRQTLNLSHRLKPQDGETTGGAGPLIYRWTP